MATGSRTAAEIIGTLRDDLLSRAVRSMIHVSNAMAAVDLAQGALYEAMPADVALMPVPTTLFLVFQLKGECDAAGHFEFQGAFDSRERAEAACREENYCVFPCTLNLELPHETVAAPGCYYPKLQGRPS